MEYYVYILSNKLNTAIYTGVTRDLVRRVYEHKHHMDPNSYTAKYDVTKLVYYESTSDVNAAIEREKQIKGWNRKRKTNWWKVKIPLGQNCTISFCCKGNGLPRQCDHWLAMTIVFETASNHFHL